MLWSSRKYSFQCLCVLGIGVVVILSYAHTRFVASNIGGSTSARINHNVTNQKFKSEAGYVVVLGYGYGQLAWCSAGLVSLQCWIQSFNLSMHVVEPLISRSSYIGLPEEGAIRLSEVFDTPKIHHLAKWDDFLQTAPRNIIFVSLMKYNKNKKPGSYVDWEINGLQNKERISCKYMKTFNYLHNRGFCVVKLVSTVVNNNYPFTAEDFYNVILKNWKQEEVTLIFNVWSPHFLVYNPKLENPSFCQSIDQHSFLPPSRQLLQAVKKYEHQYLNPSTSVAVMMRSEHFLLSLGDNVRKNSSLLLQKIKAGLSQLVAITSNLLSRFPQGKLFVAADVGKYGSFTWEAAANSLGTADRTLSSHVRGTFQDAVTALYNHSLSFEEWEDSFYTATNGKGGQTYRAVLEMSIAARAQCLLLFGGGTFHLLALHEYLRNHPTPTEQCWKFLGVRRNFKWQYSHLLANYSGMKITDLDLTSSN